MIDSDNLLRFDLFQQLVEWLNISMRDQRKGRHFLETNELLMDSETNRELERLIAAQVEEKIEVKQQMQHLQALLHDVHRRGNKTEAIREAYVNTYGGLALDLPPWLNELEEQRMQLLRLRRPDRTTRNHVRLLRAALDHAKHDRSVAPEVIAELQNELAYTLLQGPHPTSQTEYIDMLEQAMSYHESALQVYTFERYPFQYAKTYSQLGIICQHFGIASGKQEFIEQAISSYKTALWVYDREKFPEQWTMLQTYMGCAYAYRSQGKTSDNIDYAIYCHEIALYVVPRTLFPTIWATAQTHLGDAYRQRITGDRPENLKRAMACYREALLVFTQKSFPREWAAIHTKLGFIFQHARAEEIEMDVDMNLRCAIVCYEGALDEVYTLESFPVERAATLVSLGNVHRRRPGGNQRENLELAQKCYLKALEIFTDQAFPLEYQQTSRNLSETMQLLQK
jgi:tetratricopeptide (TPR) repeat protein